MDLKFRAFPHRSMINNIKIIGIVVKNIANIFPFKCLKIFFHFLILFFCWTLTLSRGISSITRHSIFFFGLTCNSLENVTIHVKYILWLVALKSCCFGLFWIFKLYSLRLLFLKLVIVIFVFIILVVVFLCLSMTIGLVKTWFQYFYQILLSIFLSYWT